MKKITLPKYNLTASDLTTTKHSALLVIKLVCQIPKTNDIIQDLTYVAILKTYGAAADCTIAKPVGYNPAEFDGSCTKYYKDLLN